ncbi:MAG: DUF3617 domain-containing protein [Gammaproteobacteria bacterium]|nr:MAG: DUF3617 domain-containing protein [Gammaproteobacteria bacterium]
MNFLSKAAPLLLLTSISANLHAGDYDYKPGLWEIKTTMEVEGVPAQMKALMKVPPVVEQECIKANEDLFKSDNECKYDTKRINANKIQVTFKCLEDGREMTGKGETTFSGETLSSWTEMKTQGPTGPMTMKNTTTGKYIGSCK